MKIHRLAGKYSWAGIISWEIEWGLEHSVQVVSLQIMQRTTLHWSSSYSILHIHSIFIARMSTLEWVLKKTYGHDNDIRWTYRNKIITGRTVSKCQHELNELPFFLLFKPNIFTDFCQVPALPAAFKTMSVSRTVALFFLEANYPERST
jgi:hypothetical protein